jgi:predicted branched-subunit amino acid permease
MTRTRLDLATLRAAAVPTLPLLGSIVVSFMTVGAAARSAGFDLPDSVAMTAFVFAAPAQLVMIDMLKSGVGIGAVSAAVALINLRLLFMAFAVVSSLRTVPVRRMAIWCAMLSGLSFTRFKLHQRDGEAAEDARREELELAVSCVLLYGAAVLSTAVGNALGSLATPVWVDGLDLMVAMLLLGRIFNARGGPGFIATALACAVLTPLAKTLTPAFGTLLMAFALSWLFAVSPRIVDVVGHPRRHAPSQKP